MEAMKKGRKRSWDMQPWKRQSTSKDQEYLTRISQ